ncbi:MAG: Rieske 2Fe-2S domain-containing protein [Chloroflexi bacterium]|nr:Rieske 2Fe-2S domain-containing protein [Chloroflexota bacterium]
MITPCLTRNLLLILHRPSRQQVQPQQVTLYQWGERRFILTRLDGQVYAFSSECPHASGDMSVSTISRKGRIDCPDHGYVFDIRSGRITWPEDENYCLRKYPVKEVDGVVWVQLPVISQP